MRKSDPRQLRGAPVRACMAWPGWRGVRQAAETDVFGEISQVALAARSTRLLLPAPQRERTCEVVFSWFSVYKGVLSAMVPGGSGSSEPCRREPCAGAGAAAEPVLRSQPMCLPVGHLGLLRTRRAGFGYSYTVRPRGRGGSPRAAWCPSMCHAKRTVPPQCCTPTSRCAHRSVLCALTAGLTRPAAEGMAPGGCQDLGVTSRPGVLGDRTTPESSSCAPVVLGQTTDWPRATGWWVLSRSPCREASPVSSSSSPSPPSQFWGCWGADSEAPLAGASSCSLGSAPVPRQGCAQLPRGGQALFFQALLLPSRAVHMRITLLRSSESCRSAEIPHAKRGRSHPSGEPPGASAGDFPPRPSPRSRDLPPGPSPGAGTCPRVFPDCYTPICSGAPST